ncbi:MAG: HU family DNA-binding protein [Prevotella sp.]|uniref:HU family DNA-binding protein n=1 Tax=Prevotella sp. PTAC TaxID=2736295 RepID=UPI001555795B|nr:HU family DNA-binding protein [Prevotella sp. PTAC]MCX4293683.1 HU family DNA-binding protein [Prevotella sp.]NPD55182.1 DNA-binding protein [Prevotella sp. PTAC]
MSVFYRLYQNNNKRSRVYKKWYARAVMVDTMSTRELAEIMQENCTVKRSDIEAVLRELVPTMTRAMQDSKRVKIDGLGSFKIGLKTKPSVSPKEFSSQKNVLGMHINFMPETYKDSGTNRRVTDLLRRCAVAELPKNAVITDEDEVEAQP